MVDRKTITDLLATAVYAPSGDNSQPWRFEVRNDDIYIFSEAEKDNPKFNYKQRGTLLAHGALIENILIFGPTLGLTATATYFPDPNLPQCTACVHLTISSPKENLLAAYIKKRSTNRKPFSNNPLSRQQRDDILNVAKDIGTGRIILTEDLKQKEIIGQAVSVNEIVMLEDRVLHDLFFGDVRWTEQEEQKYKTGLYLKTMELEKPKEIAFRILKWWPAAAVLTKLGMAKFIAKENAKLYCSGAAIGVVCIAGGEDKSFLDAGRLTQRLWLTAAAQGLSMHPLTGVIYLHQRFAAQDFSGFSEEHVEAVERAYKKIADIFKPEKNEIIAMLFRVGHSQPPTAMSSKLAPKIKFE